MADYSRLPAPNSSGPAIMTVQPVGSPSMNIQRSFARQLDLPPSEHPVYEGILTCLGDCTGCLGAYGCCCCPNPMKVVQQGEVGLIARFGKWYRSVDPGLWSVNVVTEQLRTVDIKIQVDDIPRQSIMTKDNVMVLIDSVIYWHVVDPYTAAYLVSNVRTALIERTQTTLRQILGQRMLQDCIENRDTIAHEVQNIIEGPAEQWGVRVESMLIKDLQFSQELQETLSSAAKQKRVGESKVIAAQAEVNAAKLMREASDILNTPAAMQIRYLETLGAMSRNAGTKVIFMPAVGGGSSIGVPDGVAATSPSTAPTSSGRLAPPQPTSGRAGEMSMMGNAFVLEGLGGR